MNKYLLIIPFILVSCGSFDDKKEEKQELKYIDIEQEQGDAQSHEFVGVDEVNIERAFNELQESRELMRENVQKGIERRARFKPLIYELIKFDATGVAPKLESISPFIDELEQIYSMYSAGDSQNFVRLGTRNEENLKILFREAEKAETNKKAYQEAEEHIEFQRQEIRSLNDTIDEGSHLVAKKWAGIFFGLSALFFVGFGVVKVFFAGMASKTLATMGGLFSLLGSALLILTTAMEFIREFLKEWGNSLMLLLLIPVIILSVIAYSKCHVFKKDDDDDEPTE